MKDGFIRVGAASPLLRVADCRYNATALAKAAREAAARGVRVLLFPELSLTAYTVGDLFAQPLLLRGAEEALASYVKETEALDMLSFVGLPVSVGEHIYNCTAAVSRGRLLGLVPKTYPAAAEDERTFSPAPTESIPVSLAGSSVLLGTRQLFVCEELPSLAIAAEIGTDAHAAIPPAAAHTAAGATLIANPAAIPALVGAAEETRLLRTAFSRRTRSAYLYANAGGGESGTDLVFGGDCLLLAHGDTVAECPPFDGIHAADGVIDPEALLALRRTESASTQLPTGYARIPFFLSRAETTLDFPVSPTPFVPKSEAERAARCAHILRVQSEGLGGRLTRAYAKTAVLGISGGLDSTLSLLVAVEAMEALSRPVTDVLAVTMPCFGTTARTKSNAEILCTELGVTLSSIDIKEAVRAHFADIGHDESTHDVTYENAQARERTQILMDLANKTGGMVVGTGDLSELALGFATYNGDHMSMYGVNATVPKTLMRHLVAYVADRYEQKGRTRVAACLRDILATPVSPELLPPVDGEIVQETESIVGPYELHDFFLYYFYRLGFPPKKIFRLARHAFFGIYDDGEIARRLRLFLSRFFSQQFKRSCLPDGPRTGSVALSPRGAWHMPSDAAATLWLAEADEILREAAHE